jgi:hypothetical protein
VTPLVVVAVADGNVVAVLVAVGNVVAVLVAVGTVVTELVAVGTAVVVPAEAVGAGVPLVGVACASGTTWYTAWLMR